MNVFRIMLKCFLLTGKNSYCCYENCKYRGFLGAPQLSSEQHLLKWRKQLKRSKRVGPRPSTTRKKIDSQNALTLRIKVTCKVLEIVEKQDLSHRNSGLIGKKTSACCSKVHLYGLSCKMQ